MFRKKDAEVYYINERSRSASEELASLFSYCIQKDGRMFRELVFLCIGSDRITGDSLGPLIGYQLSPYCSRIFHVYGTLDDPVHALNLPDRISYIHSRHPEALLVAIDALDLGAQMHKAITIIQFKLEGDIIRRRPEFDMDDRLLLHHIDLKRGTIHLDGKEYELKDKNWPTINPKDPYALSIEEEDLMHRMLHSFECSEKLKKHMRCLFRHGSMYQVCNSNLLFHASVPMNADGTLKNICIEGQEYKGKALLDKVDQLIRTAYFDSDGSPEKDFALDYIWYLWGGKDSPLFDKSKMATFERAFIDDKAVQKEDKGMRYDTGRVRGDWASPPYHQRSCACPLHPGRKPDQGKRQVAGYRRRFLQTLPSRDRYCRLYAGLSSPRFPVGTARTVPVYRPGNQGRP